MTSTKWCRDCLTGQNLNHNETPTGRMTTLYNRETYIADPPDNKPPRAVILYLPDGGGYLSANDRLLCDTYAAKGQYRVIMPDFMDGIMVPPWISDTLESLTSTSLTPTNWLMKPYHLFWTLYGFIPMMYHNTFTKSWRKIQDFLFRMRERPDPELRAPSTQEPLPIGLVGVCWGGQFALHLATDPPGHISGIPIGPGIRAIFTAHPAGLANTAKLKDIKLPISIAIGDKDMLTSIDKVHDAEAVLRQLNEPRYGSARDGSGKPSTGGRPVNVDTELKVYEGAHHGFAVRVDKSNPKVYEQAVQAEDQCIAWLEKHLFDPEAATGVRRSPRHTRPFSGREQG